MTETNTLNAAMAKFQEGYKPPVRNNKVDFKTAKGQRIKYDYADLRALQDAIRHTGSPLGIGFRTSFEQFEQFNSLWLKAVVTITHAEREVKVDGIPLFVASSSSRMPDAQASGSLRTYAERYALQSAFGIASDSDDDGAIAKDKYQNQPKQQSEQPQQSQLPPENQQFDEKEGKKHFLNNSYTEFFKNHMTAQDYGATLANAIGVQDIFDAHLSALVESSKFLRKQIQAKQEQPKQPQNDFKWGQ